MLFLDTLVDILDSSLGPDLHAERVRNDYACRVPHSKTACFLAADDFSQPAA